MSDPKVNGPTLENSEENESPAEEPNEWTVMFYLAGDSDLSPVLVPQVKAIKEAGFQENAKVIVYFDSNENGVPTRIYNVNAKRKQKAALQNRPRTSVGDGSNPFVHNMLDDNIDLGTIKVVPKSATEDMKNGLMKPDSLDASSALKNFILFCREQHPAKHYILFLVGHGIIVGNDSFLPDEHPVSAISLAQLDTSLRAFKKVAVDQDKSTFELLALHSCSMSSIEVSYQLKGTARFMMASEGLSFVGSWPYRQLLKKSFNSFGELQRATRAASRNGNLDEHELELKLKEIEKSHASNLIEKLYFFSLYGSRDVTVAGYSLDLCLSSLDEGIVGAVRESLQKLIAVLKSALKDSLDADAVDRQNGAPNPRGKELILLAHWESQSYWQEDYTDLFDFCFCLDRLCSADIEAGKVSGADTKLQEKLKVACGNMTKELAPSKDFDKLIVHSDNFGWKYQYSHGLAIYFPWSEPLGDVNKSVMKNYEGYAFHRDFIAHKEVGEDLSWLSFLRLYFKKTMRASRREEEPKTKGQEDAAANHFLATVEDVDPFGPLGDDPGKVSPAVGDPGKVSPTTGLDCSCPSIKNYPAEKITIKGKEQNVRSFAITDGAAGNDFNELSDGSQDE